MRFTVYYRGQPVGWSELDRCYPPMSAVAGSFHANENFEQIRPVFHQHHLNDGTYGHEDEIDADALEAARRAIDQLELTIRAENGEELKPGQTIMISIEEAYPDFFDEPLTISLTELPYEQFHLFWAEQAAEFWENTFPMGRKNQEE